MLSNENHLHFFGQTTTFRHFTQMIMSFGNHEIADDDEIQTQHFGFTLFVPFWFKIETSGFSNPVMCGLTSQG